MSARGRDVTPLEGYKYPTNFGQPVDEHVRRVKVKAAVGEKLRVWEQVFLALSDGLWHGTNEMYRLCSPRWRDEVARIREALPDAIEAERDPNHPTGYRYRLKVAGGNRQEGLF